MLWTLAWFLSIPAAWGAISFGPEQIIAIPELNGPSTAIAVDLDSDGDRDVLGLSQLDGRIAWFENLDGNGTFGPPRFVGPPGTAAGSLVAADLDGDGHPDLLAGSRDADRILWYPNSDGKGTFTTTPVIVDGATDVASVLAADLDGDGDLDVVATAPTVNRLAWYANDGTGHFGPPQRIGDDTYRVGPVVAADLDGDGDLDLFASGYVLINDGVVAFLNTDGKGTFAPLSWVNRWDPPAASLVAADLDGDGDLDGVAASRSDNTLIWYENRGKAERFSNHRIGDALSPFSSVTAADLDADGDPDLSIACGDSIAWMANDGTGAFGPQQTVDARAQGARSVSAADLDGDGDLDLLAAAQTDDAIYWYENTDGAGGFGSPRPITESVSSASRVLAADLDDDGDPDLLSSSTDDGRLVWYENPGGADPVWPPRRIAADLPTWPGAIAAGDLDGDGDTDLLAPSPAGAALAWYANSDGRGDFQLVQAIEPGAPVWDTEVADLDGDGDADVIAAVSLGSDTGGAVLWYQNTDGAGAFGPAATVATNPDHGPTGVVAADLDRDGDLDLLASCYSCYNDKLTWLENFDGAGHFGPARVIAADAGSSWEVAAADLDGDGDLDVVAAATQDGKQLAWYENDGLGQFGAARLISAAVVNPRAVAAADLDGDGDLDVLSASPDDNTIASYENLDGKGTFGPRQALSETARYAQSVVAADLDRDGDLDAVSASESDGKLAWYENRLPKPAATGRDLVLVLDLSGSMGSPACPGDCEPKIDLLKDAVELFYALWKELGVPEDRTGVVYFRTGVERLTLDDAPLFAMAPNAEAVVAAVQGQGAHHLTALGAGIQTAVAGLAERRQPRSLIVFTDGMQNVNPMVVEATAGGASGLVIDLKRGIGTSSGVAPQSPPLALDTALDIRINTLGVGTYEPFQDLLARIAADTGGLSLTTNAPDADLREFFVQALTEALKDRSPQLVDYRHGRLTGTEVAEHFQINASARKLVLALSWPRPAPGLSFAVYKDGRDLTALGRLVDGPFYRIFVLPIPIPGGPPDTAGDWTLRISGTPDTAYQAAAILDDPLLDIAIEAPAAVAAGTPIALQVRLTAGGHPLTEAQVVARVFKPGASLATLVSTTPLPSPTGVRPLAFSWLTNLTAAARVPPQPISGAVKLQTLLQVPEFHARLRPSERTLVLTGRGDGSFVGQFDATDLTGTYRIAITMSGQAMSGQAPALGAFERRATVTTLVHFGVPDLARSHPRASVQRGVEPGTRLVRVAVRPIDQAGNYLGPDSADRLAINPGPGGRVLAVRDQGDGTYLADLIVPRGLDPPIGVRINDQTLFAGRLSELVAPGAGVNWGAVLLAILIGLRLFGRWASRRP